MEEADRKKLAQRNICKPSMYQWIFVLVANIIFSAYNVWSCNHICRAKFPFFFSSYGTCGLCEPASVRVSLLLLLLRFCWLFRVFVWCCRFFRACIYSLHVRPSTQPAGLGSLCNGMVTGCWSIETMYTTAAMWMVILLLIQVGYIPIYIHIYWPGISVCILQQTKR